MYGGSRFRSSAQHLSHDPTQSRFPEWQVYKPSEAEKADARLYADNVRALMSRELGAPMVNVGTREEFVLKRSGVVVRLCGLLHPAGDLDGLYFPLSVTCNQSHSLISPCM